MSIEGFDSGSDAGVEDEELYEFPLSPAQGALWFINRFDPESPAYNIPICVRMRGQLDIEALQKALDYLVERHEIFRTFYGNNDVEGIQYVRNSGECPLQLDDISGLEADEREKVLDTKIRVEASKAFDLQTGPVLRAKLLVLSDREFCLLIMTHHITVDHSAVGLYVRQLERAYECFLNGKEPDLPEQELQYADYVIWLKENLHQEEVDKKLQVWMDRLKGFSGILNLPVDKPRPAVTSMRGEQYNFEFGLQVSSQIKNFSRGQSVSLYLCLLSAFKVLLHRYCQQDDVIVATPFANRGDQEELENVVGCFINTLPLATDFSQISDFSSLIAKVKEVMLEAYDNQSVPLEVIVDAVKPKRDLSHNPLFQVGFIFQDPPIDVNLHGLECDTLALHSGGAMYDLHVWMWEDGDRLCGHIWYNTDIYVEASIARMVDSFVAAVTSLTSNPQRDIRQAQLLAPAEQKMMDQWNDTAVPWPEGKSLLDLIAETVTKTPEAIAVKSDGGELSYAELELRSNHLANYLGQEGVSAGDFVGICLDRSADLLVALLGVLKVGAAYVPLDPDYPNDRLLYMLEQSQVAVLVTQSMLATSLPDYQCQHVKLDTDWDEISSSKERDHVGPGADSLMYLIFTSGSTGLPKGVQVTHSTVVNFLAAMAQSPGLCSEDKLLAVTTLSFDIAVLELFLPLVVGATVIVAGREDSVDGQKLAELIQRHSVTVMQATPSTWRMLIAAGWEGSESFKVLCGGEAFPRDLAGELLSRAGEVWNMYGPTETTVWSTCYRLEDAESPILIGRPIANTQCYVVNEEMRRQPVGVAGELFIGGEGVTAGYLNRPDLTQERFVDDPFSSTQSTLYRTGDLVCWREDGTLEYFNRLDSQVKIRGFRIELEEIEKTLLKLDNVSECAVLVRERGELDKRLVGYIQFKDDQTMTSSEVRSYLRDFLPDYMVLQHLIEMESMPLTPNGKVDRKSLPDPFYNLGLDHSDDFVEPSSDVEKALAQMWAEVIGLDKVSADSNFFDIGGHSLLALGVLYRLEHDFGVKLHPRDMLMNSLEQIALQLRPSGTDVSVDTGAEEIGAKVDEDNSDLEGKGIVSRVWDKLTRK